jgi:excisionase family DNA binding protein
MATKQTYTTSEAADILEMSSSTLRRLVAMEIIPCTTTYGGHYRFTLENLTKYQKAQNA